MDSADVMLLGKGKVLRPIRTSRNYNVTSGVPVNKHYNHDAEKWAYETVMKMDDDEARMFVTLVTHEVLVNHIQKNARAINSNIRAINHRIAKAAERVNPDLIPEIERISKAMTIDGKFDEYKRDQSGRFSAQEKRVRTSRGIKPATKRQERSMGIPSAGGLARAHGTAQHSQRLRGESRSAYQQQYLAIADSLDRAADLGQSKIKVTLQDRSTGRRTVKEVGASNFGMGGGRKKDSKPGKMDWWNPGLQDVVSVSEPVSAQYDLVSALSGGSRDAARAAAGVDPRSASTFASEWHNTSRDPRGSSTAATYRRIGAGAELLGSVSTSPKAQVASQFGRMVAEYGPEAEKVVGPAMRRASYRYRGTEKDPDKKIVSDAKRLAEVAHTQNYMSRDLPAHKQGMERMKGASAEIKMVEARKAAIRGLQDKLPDMKLSELHRKSGKIPPSEGVIIDANGDIVTQAVGFAEDHYLPFNLRKLAALKGGSYVRTRSTGGLTTEDIYTGLVSGARQVTVVSNSGIFTLDFADDFRGVRRYNDKAAAMVERYAKTLDAIKHGQIERMKLDPAEKARIVEEAQSQGYTGASLDRRVKELEREYKSNPYPSTKEIERMEEKVLDAIWEDDSIIDKEGEFKRIRAKEINDMIEDKQQRFYSLDGEGYSIALEALKEQFPYYIDDMFFVNRKNMKRYGQDSTDPNDPNSRSPQQQRFTTATDSGYVKARHNRPDAVQEGYYDTRIAGEGKISASETNFQNYSHSPSRSGDRQRSRMPQDAPGAPGEAQGGSGTQTPDRRAQQAARAVAAQEQQKSATKDALTFLSGLGDNVRNISGDENLQASIKAAAESFDANWSNAAKRQEVSELISRVDQEIDAYLSSPSTPEADKATVRGYKNTLGRYTEKIKSAENMFSAKEFPEPAYQSGADNGTMMNEHARLSRELNNLLPNRSYSISDATGPRTLKNQLSGWMETVNSSPDSPEADQAITSFIMESRDFPDSSVRDSFIAGALNNPAERKEIMGRMKAAHASAERMESLAQNYALSSFKAPSGPRKEITSTPPQAQEGIGGLEQMLQNQPAQPSQQAVGSVATRTSEDAFETQRLAREGQQQTAMQQAQARREEQRRQAESDHFAPVANLDGEWADTARNMYWFSSPGFQEMSPSDKSVQVRNGVASFGRAFVGTPWGEVYASQVYDKIEEENFKGAMDGIIQTKSVMAANGAPQHLLDGMDQLRSGIFSAHRALR